MYPIAIKHIIFCSIKWFFFKFDLYPEIFKYYKLNYRLSRWNCVMYQPFHDIKNLYLNWRLSMQNWHVKVQLQENILYIGATNIRFLLLYLYALCHACFTSLIQNTVKHWRSGIFSHIICLPFVNIWMGDFFPPSYESWFSWLFWSTSNYSRIFFFFFPSSFRFCLF